MEIQDLLDKRSKENGEVFWLDESLDDKAADLIYAKAVAELRSKLHQAVSLVRYA